MQELLDCSLIETVYAGDFLKFRMLETVRNFVRFELSADHLERLRRRHLDWVIELSESVSGPYINEKKLQELSHLEMEVENIHEAFRYAASEAANEAFLLAANLAPFWVRRSSGFEPNLLLDELFDKQKEATPSRLMLDAYLAHCMVSFCFQFDVTSERYERTQQLIDQFGNESERRLVSLYQSILASGQLNYEEAERLCGLAANGVSKDCQDDFAGLLWRLQGAIPMFRGEFGPAIESFRRAVRFYEGKDDVFFVALTRLNLAAAAVEAGDFDLAEAVTAGLLEVAQRIRYDQIICRIYHLLGRLAEERGSFDEAVLRFSAAREIWARNGSNHQVAEQECALAKTLYGHGDFAEAGKKFADAAQRWHAEDTLAGVVLALCGVSGVCYKLGDVGKATMILAASLAEIQRLSVRYLPNQKRFVESVTTEIFASGDVPSPNCSTKEALELSRTLFRSDLR